MYKSIVKQSVDYIGKYIERGILIGVPAFLSFCLIKFGLITYSKLVSQTITNQTELEEILKEEESKLGIIDKRISAKFGKANGGNGHCNKLPDGSYNITLQDGKEGNRSTLRHELYHIYDGHLEDKKSISNELLKDLKYFFVYEPQAVLYQSLDVRL